MATRITTVKKKKKISIHRIERHLKFLLIALIPDLRRSGNSVTADNFKLDHNIIKQLIKPAEDEDVEEFFRSKGYKSFSNWEELYLDNPMGYDLKQVMLDIMNAKTK